MFRYLCRKGRCRFGHKCTFAHDSDVNLKKPDPAEREPTFSAPHLATAASKADDSTVHQSEDGGYDDGAVICGEDSQGVKKGSSVAGKKRPGLSEGLVPGKKAMKFHNKVYNNSGGAN